MNIFLIRHGESKGNKERIIQGQSCEGLTELGFEQAQTVADYFQKVDAIYSSDSKRAIQTATPTAEKFGLQIKTTPDLREASFGIWENMFYDDVKTKYESEFSAWLDNYFTRPEWFESFEAHQNRVSKAIKEILQNEKKDKTILVFSHGGSIKTQVQFFKKLNGKELHEFNQANCSIVEIDFSLMSYEKGNMLYYGLVRNQKIENRN